MKDRLLKEVKDFLGRYFVPGKPLLVGFSGGPDSLALLHVLLENRRFFDLDLRVAHVDHGWREESAEEAKNLHDTVLKLGLPFVTTRLQGLPHTEEAGREGRLAFFKKMVLEHGCQAVVLGHHGDDQSETVLKRILEGSSFRGIKAVSTIDGMQVWRPFLKLEKATLRKWVDQRGLQPLEDPTNHDLRSRMRTNILPRLEKEFGKGVGENLRRLSLYGEELEQYLEERLKKYEPFLCRTEVDFSSEAVLDRFEVKAFLKIWAKKNKVFLSYTAIQTLYELLEKGTCHRRVGSPGGWVEIHRRRIAIKKI